MNKKSAMAIAGGLVAAVLSAAGAISVGLGNRTAAQTPPPPAAKPIVKTIRRTITIHKKAKSSPAPSVVTLAPSAPAPAPVTTVSSGSLAGGGESDDSEGQGGDD